MKAVVLYEAPASAMQQMAKATPEQMKSGMDAWMSWKSKAGNAVVDLGMPLGNARAISKAGVANEKSQIVRFSILEGESIEEIAALLKDHPHLHLPGSSIKVLEELPMPGA